MVEQRTADVRTVGWSLRQKEILGIVLDVIHSLRSSAHALNLNAFSVPLINLMSHSMQLTALFGGVSMEQSAPKTKPARKISEAHLKSDMCGE